MKMKMDIRKNLFWHPVHGELAKLSGDEYSYENKDTIIHEAPLYIGQPMETVYERDRRLWVEQAVLKQLTKEDNASSKMTIEYMTEYYCNAYDWVQASITNFQTNG